LHYIAFNGHTEEICELLLEYGGKESVNKEDKDGFTPLSYAAFNGHTEIFKSLLKHCSKELVNKWENNGNTLLHATV
jgi:ankyrin repeat protein